MNKQETKPRAIISSGLFSYGWSLVLDEEDALALWHILQRGEVKKETYVSGTGTVPYIPVEAIRITPTITALPQAEYAQLVLEGTRMKERGDDE